MRLACLRGAAESVFREVSSRSPPPLRRVLGGRAIGRLVSYPPPQPSPTRGEGGDASDQAFLMRSELDLCTFPEAVAANLPGFPGFLGFPRGAPPLSYLTKLARGPQTTGKQVLCDLQKVHKSS